MKDIEFWIDGAYYREKEENVIIFQKSFEKKTIEANVNSINFRI